MSSYDSTDSNTIATDAIATAMTNSSRPEPEFTEKMASTVRGIAQSKQLLEGPLLPILHAIQDEFGYLPPPSVPIIADVLNLSRADVHGVVSFYHDFRHQLPANRIVKVCRAEACQAMGAENLFQQLSKTMSQCNETDIESIYCLGNCALAPAVMIDATTIGQASVEKIAAVLDQVTD